MGLQSAKFNVVFNITRESLNFEPPVFENASRYPNSETNFLCSHDRPYEINLVSVCFFLNAVCELQLEMPNRSRIVLHSERILN